MKSLNALRRLVLRPPILVVAAMGLCSPLAPVLRAQDATVAPVAAKAAAPAPASELPPVRLSPAESVILTLARAHVGDDVTLAYIKQTGKAYHLGVSEILYLREQGVSDHVLAAMLSARPGAVAASAPTSTQPAPAPATDWVTTSPQPTPAYNAAAAIYTQPVYAQPVYTQPNYIQPVYVPPTRVYAYPTSYYGYYDSWPCYSGYPLFSVGIGFGGGYYGGYRGGYYRGGYHGGGHYAGGYHGGGFHGGHR